VPTVLIPWRAGCPHREDALAWLTDRLPYPVAIGTCGAGRWCKADAVADALARCDDDIVVVSDADVWCDRLDDAITAVSAGAAWAVPHRLVHRLTDEATTKVLNGSTLEGPTTERPYLGYPGGGIVVTTRAVLDDCPLDPRFVGWGQEDEAWALALTALHGRPWRGSAPLWHLWHPPAERMTRRWGSDTNRQLLRRYRAAGRRPAEMRRLIEEARRWPAPA